MKTTIQHAALVAGALFFLTAPDVDAACASASMKAGFSAAKAAAPISHAQNSDSHEGFNASIESSNNSIVGLWNTTFLLGKGPAIWDQGFEQWHSDGTELNVDNAVPPSLGNVCVGVYKQTGPRTYKLRHVTWNWDLSGNLTGTFLLLMTVTVDPRGDTFTGSYVSDSFDLNGQVIPALHADGVVSGQRITVD
jgi:hypothetical protein